jgi:transcriptional regulator
LTTLHLINRNLHNNKPQAVTTSHPPPYIPVNFNSDINTAQTIIQNHPFASLITAHKGDVFVTQIPFLLKKEDAQYTLIGHMARANPHSAALLEETDAVQATVQFTGINGYISPAWYAVNTGVPTWNYETVQVRGTIHLIQNLVQTEAVVKSLIDAFDAQADLVKQAWADSAAAAQAAQLNAILAFEIRIDALYPKTKLSQNRPLVDRQRVIQQLENGSRSDASLAHAMSKALPN